MNYMVLLCSAAISVCVATSEKEKDEEVLGRKVKRRVEDVTLLVNPLSGNYYYQYQHPKQSDRYSDRLTYGYQHSYVSPIQTVTIPPIIAAELSKKTSYGLPSDFDHYHRYVPPYEDVFDPLSSLTHADDHHDDRNPFKPKQVTVERISYTKPGILEEISMQPKKYSTTLEKYTKTIHEKPTLNDYSDYYLKSVTTPKPQLKAKPKKQKKDPERDYYKLFEKANPLEFTFGKELKGEKLKGKAETKTKPTTPSYENEFHFGRLQSPEEYHYTKSGKNVDDFFFENDYSNAHVPKPHRFKPYIKSYHIIEKTYMPDDDFDALGSETIPVIEKIEKE